jgi:hypothetical protein
MSPTGPAGGASRAGIGRACVEVLTALDAAMDRAEHVFPAVGPPPCTPVGDVRDVVEQRGELLPPELLAHARRWLDQHDAFRLAADRVEALDHRQRARPPEVARDLAASLRGLRDARHHLDELACQLREAAAAHLDRVMARPPQSLTATSERRLSRQAADGPATPPAAPSAGRVWTVELVFTEAGDRTRADALLRGGDERGHGWGRASRDPDDPVVPVVGEEIAAARALSDLSRQLMAAAAGRVGLLEGQPVRIHR